MISECNKESYEGCSKQQAQHQHGDLQRFIEVIVRVGVVGVPRWCQKAQRKEEIVTHLFVQLN